MSVVHSATGSTSRLLRRLLRPTASPVSLYRQPSLRSISTHPVHKPLARSQNSTSVSRSVLPSRTFATTLPQYKTICAVNPVKNPDGTIMHMEMAPRAAQRLTKIMNRDKNPGLALRIVVESGGCHGFQYNMNMTTLPAPGSPTWSESVAEDDVIFQYLPDDAAEAGDLMGSPKMILDESSLDLLKDSKVDFTQELIGSQFKIDNPRAKSSCGCGTSFDIAL